MGAGTLLGGAYDDLEVFGIFEVSFFHYLTRRVMIEDIVSFMGDEQDILSLYLINGLCLHRDRIGDQTLMFRDVDHLVRQDKTPQNDRSLCTIHGPKLPYYWRTLVEEVYVSDHRRRFDIIQVVLNQDPHGLSGIAGLIVDWKNGRKTSKNREVMLARMDVGRRTFVIAVYLAQRKLPLAENSTNALARSLLKRPTSGSMPLDVVVITKVRKSKHWAFDGISFFRMIKRTEASVPDA